MKQPRLAVGCDHAAVAMKDDIVRDLRGAGLQVEDVGAFNQDSVDYPDFAALVAARVTSGAADLGIALCGTGIGVAIAANKIRGVRAAVCHDVTTARLSRQHNDANVLCMGARIIGPAVAADIVKEWLAADFEGGRHKRRVEKIEALEATQTVKR
ncbi:MAG TPA: ribose 5-phosphate isomerase B [Patescibacteria group bacterium]|jgi:ribose 5-phosphate isomerase B|nr:ribose 5-phosphate isomerase B [Patescibacteria group bacterium]